MRMLKGGPVGAVGTVRSFMDVVKDVDFQDTRDRAEQMPSIVVIGTTHERAQEAADRLFGRDDRNGISVQSWDGAASVFDAGRQDVTIVYDPDGSGLLDSVRQATKEHEHTRRIFFLSGSLESSEEAVRAVRFDILEMSPDMAPSFGRFHPEWRRAAVSAIIDQTSRANAQFALVSNIPSVIPILGSVITAGADLIVLTKNQVMMCYKIAAAHGEDLENHLAILRELTPVVGAGFLWRTAAREAAAFVPFAAGTIPKVAIAFAGTLTMGKAADYYYQHGVRPSRKQLDSLKHQAAALAERLPIAKDLFGEDEAIAANFTPRTEETASIAVEEPAN